MGQGAALYERVNLLDRDGDHTCQIIHSQSLPPTLDDVGEVFRIDLVQDAHTR